MKEANFAIAKLERQQLYGEQFGGATQLITLDPDSTDAS